MPSQSHHPRDAHLAAEITNAVQRVFRENSATIPSGSPVFLPPHVEHLLLLAIFAELPLSEILGSSDRVELSGSSADRPPAERGPSRVPALGGTTS